jgi:hypothetical protein
MQTTVDIYYIMEYIKQQELNSDQLDSLISSLIDYKAEVDKQSMADFVSEETMKDNCIL